MSAFTNLKYDECQQAQQIRESIGPCHHILNTPTNHPECRPCFYNDPYVRLQKIPLRLGETQPTYNNIKVDVESEMFGITRNATKCPTKQYFPQYDSNGISTIALICNKCKSGTQCNMKDMSCPDSIIKQYLYANQYAEACNLFTEDSRLNDPPATLRCTGINRFEWLCKDPQKHTEVSFDYIVNTRILTKDTHRPYLQKPMDQSTFSPISKSGVCGTYDIRLCPQPIGGMKQFEKPNDLSDDYVTVLTT